MTESAAAVYLDLRRKCEEAEAADDSTSSHCTTFRMVEEAVKKFIPRNPIDKRYALAGDLSNIFRVKKGRMRIFWVASSKAHRVVILYIAETLRKEGDASDPYHLFTHLVMSGQYNELFDRLGMKIPKIAIKRPFTQ